MQLRFRLRTGTAGLLVDNKRCGMCKDSRCVMCDSKEVDIFLVDCEGFQGKLQIFPRLDP